jgi:hypothetical protein
MHKHGTDVAKIHVLKKTANQGWAVIKTEANSFELWAAEQPETPEKSEAIFIGRFNHLTDAELAATTLNQMWNPLLACLEIAESCKTSDGLNLFSTRYIHLQNELDTTLLIATKKAQAVMQIESSLIRQLFNLLHRTARDCSGVVVRYQRESSLRNKFTGMLRLQRTIRDTVRQIKALYTRQTSI